MPSVRALSDQPYDDGTLTRVQLIEALAERGYHLPLTTLSYWETHRRTRRGVKRWVNGTPKSLYPLEHVDVLVALIDQTAPDAEPCPCCGHHAPLDRRLRPMNARRVRP